MNRNVHSTRTLASTPTHHNNRSLLFAIAFAFAAIAAVIVASPVTAAPQPAASAKASAAVVNVNTASAEQLALLPRIGPSVAERIIEFRKENGAFKSPQDLTLVRGIGERTFELLRPYVAVSGETTLREKVASPRTDASAGGSTR